jgi:hypothetical protein
MDVLSHLPAMEKLQRQLHQQQRAYNALVGGNMFKAEVFVKLYSVDIRLGNVQPQARAVEFAKNGYRVADELGSEAVPAIFGRR